MTSVGSFYFIPSVASFHPLFASLLFVFSWVVSPFILGSSIDDVETEAESGAKSGAICRAVAAREFGCTRRGTAGHEGES